MCCPLQLIELRRRKLRLAGQEQVSGGVVFFFSSILRSSSGLTSNRHAGLVVLGLSSLDREDIRFNIRGVRPTGVSNRVRGVELTICP
jgi:hypothetical protein